MISTTQRERSDRCGVPAHPKYSLREGDSLQLNHHIAYKTLRDITITAALQPIYDCQNPQTIITNYCAITQQNRATFR